MTRKILLILLVVLAAFVIYWLTRSKTARVREAKQGPIALQTHTETFNRSIEKLMNAYHEIKNAFVDADTARAKSNTTSFIQLLDSIPLQELQKDTSMIFESATSTVNDIKSNAHSLLQQTDITEMRKDFSMVTEMLYPAFFKTINYEGPAMYLQHCPMAFDGDKGANWISKNMEVINPYLGKNHPKYKGTMLNCGEILDTIKSN